MKLFPCVSVFLLAVFPLAGIGQNIFFTDFESDAVGATTDAGEVTGFFPDRPGGIIRDSSVNAPFGAGNQYLEFSGESSRAIVSGASTQDFAGSLVGVSVDFFDTGTGTGGFGTRFGLGTGAFADTQDLNGPGSLFSVRFRTSNGTINADANTSVVSGALGTYSMQTAYRIGYIFNLTTESQLVETASGDIVDLAPMQAAFGMQDLDTGTFISNAVLGSSGSIDNTIAMVFRNFSGDETIAFYDDLSISQVTAIPEPSTYAAMLGLGALLFVGWRRRLNRATTSKN